MTVTPTDEWSRRPDRDEIGMVVSAAREAGLIDGETRSVVFHDLNLLEARLVELAREFPDDAVHTVAIKANPLVEVLRVIVEAGHGLEAASFEEVHLALAAGCPPDRIVFDSPAKTRAELERSLQLGIRVNADSLDELRRIEALREAGSTSIVGLRVNPLVGAGTIGTTSVAARDSKFGVPVDAIHDDIRRLFERHDWLRCLHVHVGSQGCTLDQLVAAVRIVTGLRDELREHGARIDHVDIGGGLPVDYDTDLAAPTIAAYAAALRAGAPELFDGTVVVTEFGRALQAGCGWAVTKVEYVKADGETPTAVVHLGADFLMRPVYQPDFWRHRFTAIDHDEGVATDPWRLAGPLCFGGDIIGRRVPLPALAVDDLIVVHDVGAYTLSTWSRHCSRGIPPVYGYRRHESIEFELLRREESPEVVVRFWSR
jgi:diaminopimelate decarboxylase